MNKSDLITKFTHNIKSFECGPDSNLRINYLLLLFQEAAYLSAEKLGFGYNSLRSRNMTWVLSNLKIQILKYPKWTEIISIATWPTGYNRLHGFRDFLLEDEKGKRLINSTSEWMAIDIESRRPININDFEIELPDYGERTLDEKLNRLNPRRFGEGKRILEVEVPFSAIDENGHVNNAEYIKWALDGLRKANIDISNLSTLQVSFISEVFENETCEIYFRESEKSSSLIWGMNAKDNEYVFAVKIE